jgi:hypothetical protein
MRRVAILAVALLVTVGATVAEAAVKNYSGTTSADDPVALKVDSKGRVYAFSFVDVHLTCSDGDEFDTGPDPIKTPTSKRYKVTKRKFKIKIREEDAGRGYDVAGKFSSGRKTVGGTFRIFANFDESFNPDPDGSAKCTSGVLKWSAKRK